MSSLASRAEAAPEGFKAQELANTIWALATCGTGPGTKREIHGAAKTWGINIKSLKKGTDIYIIYFSIYIHTLLYIYIYTYYIYTYYIYIYILYIYIL